MLLHVGVQVPFFCERPLAALIRADKGPASGVKCRVRLESGLAEERRPADLAREWSAYRFHTR